MINSIELNEFLNMYRFDKLIQQGETFLNKNKECILLDTQSKKIWNQRYSMMTAMSSIVEIIKENGLQDLFVLVDFTTSIETIPDVFDLDIVPIFHKGKLVINITKYINRRRDADAPIIFKDIIVFHNLVARGALMLCYEKFLKGTERFNWISRKISSSLVQIYSMILTNCIGQVREPAAVESIRTCFGWYYARKCQTTTDTKTLTVPPTIYNLNLQKSGYEIKDIIAQLTDNYDVSKEMTLNQLSERIKTIVPLVPESISDVYLTRIFSTGHQNTNELKVGITYPPYFMHHLVRLASGSKDYHMKFLRNFKMQTTMLEMVTDLIRSPNFIPTLIQ
ncbi:MAG: hypothetical protein GY804_09450 [Alphaproteobacteria bacterium]|nr:hypothetical protein [Alphaproteobacteria bacterium]